MLRKVRTHKYLITTILSFIAIGIVIFYSVCSSIGSTCSYLKGTILGVDLTYVGVLYMVAVIVLAALRANRMLLPLIAAGIGVEIFLVGFQIKHDRYCLYCLAFGIILFMQFLLHLDLKRKSVVALCLTIGFIAAFFLFKGQITPRYSIDDGQTSYANVHSQIARSWSNIPYHFQ